MTGAQAVPFTQLMMRLSCIEAHQAWMLLGGVEHFSGMRHSCSALMCDSSERGGECICACLKIAFLHAGLTRRRS